MLLKVFVCGVHSSGKTTLLESLKEKLLLVDGNIVFCEEVARRVIKKHGITPVMQRDVECFKKLNLLILEKQCKEEKKIEESFGDNTKRICFFDRGIIDPIIYLQMRVGSDFAKNVLEQPQILKMVERLRNEDECLVFITKPCLSYFVKDGVRLDTFDFQTSLEYDNIIQSKMEELEIPFIHIEEENLTKRTRVVIKEIFKKWPDVVLNKDKNHGF